MQQIYWRYRVITYINLTTRNNKELKKQKRATSPVLNLTSLGEIRMEILMMRQYFKTNEDFTRARRLWSLIRSKSAWALIRPTICAIWIYMYRSAERMLVQIMITNAPAHDIVKNERVWIRNCPYVRRDAANYHPVRFITSFIPGSSIVMKSEKSRTSIFIWYK